MCGVVGQGVLKNIGEKTIGVTLDKKDLFTGSETSFVANWNAWAGTSVFVITQEKPYRLQPMTFGLKFTWPVKTKALDKEGKPIKKLANKLYINARAEGAYNEDNDPRYDGPMGIFKSGAFGKAARENRCIIPVNYFLEGPEDTGLKKTPYKIHRADNKPFPLAAIWRYWTDPKTAEAIATFAIVTTSAAPLLQRVKHHRSPLVLNPEYVETWLTPDATEEKLTDIMHPFDSTGFVGDPISTEFLRRENSSRLFEPIGVALT